MSYTALYRKFRPQIFEDVKGQEHIVTTLRNQITSERIGHAYLFCGTRGTGKTTIAKLFAKTVNCEDIKQGNPCGICRSCKAIAAGASMNVIEIDAASNNGVDNIREIVDEVSYSPAEGKYKVYIIDEVHMLSTGAFNALLKTLEEPPSYVIFILATTEVHKIPITILSRCQRYDFKRITVDTITDRLNELVLAEGAIVEEKALRYIAKMGDGSMRDALSLLDQCIAFNLGTELTYERTLDILGAVDQSVFSQFFKCILENRVSDMISLIEEVIVQGRELTQFTSEFAWYLRNLLLLRTAQNAKELLDLSDENIERLQEESYQIDSDRLMRYIRIFSELSGQIKYSSQKRILLEMTAIRLCRPEMEKNYDSILERIRNLEEKLEKGVITTVRGEEYSEQTSATQTPRMSEEERKQLEKALPDDVRLIVKRWNAFIAEMERPMGIYLRGARLSIDNENKLIIILSDHLAADYFLSKERARENLEAFLSEKAGKAVSITIKSSENQKEVQDQFIDLKTIIHMDIDVEE